MKIFLIIIIITGVLLIMRTIIEILTKKKKYEELIENMGIRIRTLETKIKNNENNINYIIKNCDSIIERTEETVEQCEISINKAINMVQIVQNSYYGIAKKIEIIAETFENEEVPDKSKIDEYLELINEDIENNKKILKELNKQIPEHKGGREI